MKYDIATPYTAVYIVFRKDNRVAFVLRSNTDWMNNHYGLIAGKVEKDESFTAAAIREAQEEAGVGLKPEQLKLVLTAHRKSGDLVWVDMIFEATSWEGEVRNAEPDVHGELSWLDPDNLPENMVPSVRYYVEQVQAGNNFCEYGWASNGEV